MQQFSRLEKVDFSPIKAITHDGSCLQVLLETDNGYSIKSLPAPLQAFQGLQQLAQFATLTQQSPDGLTARTLILDQTQMIPVTSSNIAAIGYSAVCRVLQVDFLTGKRYRYNNVPSQVFDCFLAAPSKGRYLNSVIKSEFAFDYQLVQ